MSANAKFRNIFQLHGRFLLILNESTYSARTAQQREVDKMVDSRTLARKAEFDENFKQNKLMSFTIVS